MKNSFTFYILILFFIIGNIPLIIYKINKDMYLIKRYKLIKVNKKQNLNTQKNSWKHFNKIL